MPIIKIRNKTASILELYGNPTVNTPKLQASETKLCFYNRPILFDQSKIRALLRLDQIEFLNEFNDVVVKYNSNYDSNIEGDDFEFIEMLNDLITDYQPTDYYSFYNLKVKIGNKIDYLIRFSYEKAVRNNNIDPDIYSTSNLIDAMRTKNITELLNLGDIKRAGTAITQITSDAFFTNPRKTALKAICDSVVFE